MLLILLGAALGAQGTNSSPLANKLAYTSEGSLLNSYYAQSSTIETRIRNKKKKEGTSSRKQQNNGHTLLAL